VNGQTVTSRSGRQLTVRRLSERHAAALPAFHDQLSPRSRSLFTPHAYDAETVAAYIERNSQGEDLIFVLETGGDAIVGYFFLWEFTAPIPLLGIGLADDWQGEGLGKELMEILISEARATGRDGIELTTHPDNERAFRLYRSVGFQETGLVENVAGDGRLLIERKMFLPLKDGAVPSTREFKPPV